MAGNSDAIIPLHQTFLRAAVGTPSLRSLGLQQGLIHTQPILAPSLQFNSAISLPAPRGVALLIQELANSRLEALRTLVGTHQTMANKNHLQPQAQPCISCSPQVFRIYPKVEQQDNVGPSKVTTISTQAAVSCTGINKCRQFYYRPDGAGAQGNYPMQEPVYEFHPESSSEKQFEEEDEQFDREEYDLTNPEESEDPKKPVEPNNDDIIDIRFGN